MNSRMTSIINTLGLCPKSTNWLMKNNNVFVTACGTSFYEQCLPDQSVHLGLCFTSAHWLSEKYETLLMDTNMILAITNCKKLHFEYAVGKRDLRLDNNTLIYEMYVIYIPQA